MEIIRDLLWLWILGSVGGTGYILWAVLVRDAGRPAAAKPPQSVTTRRTPTAAPVAPPAVRPVAPPVRTPLPTPAAAGSPEHQRRGSAPTVKLPTAEPAKPVAGGDDDAAAADLFSGLAEAKAKADQAPTPVPEPAPAPKEPPKDAVEGASRIEDYGFHVGAKAAETAAKPEAAPVPVQPRSQTQELDDILKRIDAVLSESDAPPAEATMVDQSKQPQGQATLAVPTLPPTERTDRKVTDPNQQKLF